jgi:hypothetical protein
MPAVKSEVERPLMTPSQLSQTAEFRQLSPKMATWVLSYVQNYLDTGTFDPLVATNAAYKCSTEGNARTFGFQLLANAKINRTLNRFFGYTPEQAFREQVEKAIYKRKISVAQVQALKLFADVNGFGSDSLPKSNGYVPIAERESGPEPRFKAGDIVLVDGVKHHVTKVDANGRATEGEPL